jgi:hypothetical protein
MGWDSSDLKINLCNLLQYRNEHSDTQECYSNMNIYVTLPLSISSSWISLVAQTHHFPDGVSATGEVSCDTWAMAGLSSGKEEP